MRASGSGSVCSQPSSVRPARSWRAAQEQASAARERAASEARDRRQRELELARARREQASRSERERKAERRRQASAAAAELRAIETAIRELERFATQTGAPRGESVLDRLRRLRLLGDQAVVYFEREPAPQGRLERVAFAFGGITGAWRSPWDRSLMLAGNEHRCEALGDWRATGTQRVLSAALEQLRARRAELAPLAHSTRVAKNVRRTPGRASARKRSAPAAKAKRTSPRKRPPAPGPRARCPSCGTIYKTARNPLGLRRDSCPRCKQWLEPLIGGK